MKVKKILKIVTEIASESLGLTGQRDGTVPDVLHVYKRFAGLLSKAAGFSYEMSENGIGGLLQPDGNWTGGIGMLNRSEVDLAVMAFFVSEERSQAVTFSYPFTMTDVTFVTQRPSPSPDPSAISFIFSNSVWIAFLTTVVFTLIAFCVTFGRSHRLEKIVLDVLAASLRQPGSIVPSLLSEYLLILTWQIGMTFLTLCYTSLLLSFMSFPSLKEIRTASQLADAVAREGYQCMALTNHPVPEWLSTSDNKVFRAIGRNLRSSPLGSGNIASFINNADRKVVYVEGRLMISFLGERYFISDDFFFIVLVSIAMSKNFCCKSEINKAVRTITETGLYQKLTRDHDYYFALTELPPDTSTRPFPQTLSIPDIAGAITVLVTGHVISIMLFFIEIAVFCFKKYLL